ncbi:hypothetical protein K438DRAFT_1978911 [Mycena galopus ATCC 62051]|nr:hypothetical protein K438DRAFT_1978911 [Mycena galopus ATCC 62051]
MRRPPLYNPPSCDPSDPKSVAHYKRWVSSHEYNSRNRVARNAKTRERMAKLRAKQADDPPEVQERRLEAKRVAQKKYRENNRRFLALRARCGRQVKSFRREEPKRLAFKRAAFEHRTLEDAIKLLEPEIDASDSSDATYSGSDDEDEGISDEENIYENE